MAGGRTFYTLQTVMEKAEISRPTLKLWLERGWVPEPANDLEGKPIFDENEMAKVVAFAKTRMAEVNRGRR